MFLINFNQWKCACVGINNWVILLRAWYKCNHLLIVFWDRCIGLTFRSKFCDKCCRSRGLTKWPPNSLLSDFFSRGHVKIIVYGQRPNSVHQLKPNTKIKFSHQYLTCEIWCAVLLNFQSTWNVTHCGWASISRHFERF